MRIRDWSSDVCSSDLRERARREHEAQHREHVPDDDQLLEHAAPRPTCLRAGHRRSGYRAAPGGWSRCLYCPGMARLADQLPLAVVGERLCTDLTDVTDDPACLDGAGFWAVVVPYDAPPTFARFATIRPARPWRGPRWRGPSADAWCSSLDQERFEDGVRAIRAAIEAGDVYQVNLTRQLAAPVAGDADVAAPETGRANV